MVKTADCDLTKLISGSRASPCPSAAACATATASASINEEEMRERGFLRATIPLADATVVPIDGQSANANANANANAAVTGAAATGVGAGGAANAAAGGSVTTPNASSNSWLPYGTARGWFFNTTTT